MLKNRLVYGTGVLASIVLCYIYPNTITSLFAYTLMVLPILSFFYMMCVYPKVTYEQMLSQEVVTKGESLSYILCMRNDSRWVCPCIEVEFYRSNSILQAYFQKKWITIGDREEKVYTYDVLCTHSGKYEMGIRQMYIQDFLGIFKLPYKVRQPYQVTVYPRILPIQAFQLMRQSGDSLNREKEVGQGDVNLFSGIRAYTYGDSMKQIHWKMSAKRQELLMKENGGMGVTSTNIVLDVSMPTDQAAVKLLLEDKLIECIVSVSYYYIQHSMPVQLIYHNQTLQAIEVDQIEDFQRLYEEVSYIKFDSTTEIDRVLEWSYAQGIARENYIVITCKMMDKVYEQITCLVGQGIEVLVVYISPYETQEKEPKMCQDILQALDRLSIKCIYVGLEDELEQVF